MASDWQVKLISLKKRNEHILKTGLRSDCCFRVGPLDEKRLFQAHKLMLSNASPVFELMFYGSLPEKDNEPIEISDIEADDFYDMLHFIYTEDISIASVDKAQQLYYAANKYMLKQLMQECIDYLKKNKTKDNVCGIFEFAKQFDERSLEEDCMDFIKKNTSWVLNSFSLLLANISTLDAILSQDRLNILKELELFNALERYADFNQISISGRNTSIKKEEVVEDAKDQSTDEITLNNTAKKIKLSVNQNVGKANVSRPQTVEDIENFLKLLKKIRFLTFSPADFGSGPVFSRLLTKEDAFNLSVCIAQHSNCRNHFPHGYDDSKVNRF